MSVEPSLVRLVPLETLEIYFTSSTMYGHRKKTVVYESGSGPSLGTESAGVLILDFPILPEL